MTIPATAPPLRCFVEDVEEDAGVDGDGAGDKDEDEEDEEMIDDGEERGRVVSLMDVCVDVDSDFCVDVVDVAVSEVDSDDVVELGA